jgi:hypothetical protein
MIVASRMFHYAAESPPTPTFELQPKVAHRETNVQPTLAVASPARPSPARRLPAQGLADPRCLPGEVVTFG